MQKKNDDDNQSLVSNTSGKQTVVTSEGTLNSNTSANTKTLAYTGGNPQQDSDQTQRNKQRQQGGDNPQQGGDQTQREQRQREQTRKNRRPVLIKQIPELYQKRQRERLIQKRRPVLIEQIPKLYQKRQSKKISKQQLDQRAKIRDSRPQNNQNFNYFISNYHKNFKFKAFNIVFNFMFVTYLFHLSIIFISYIVQKQNPDQPFYLQNPIILLYIINLLFTCLFAFPVFFHNFQTRWFFYMSLLIQATNFFLYLNFFHGDIKPVIVLTMLAFKMLYLLSMYRLRHMLNHDKVFFLN